MADIKAELRQIDPFIKAEAVKSTSIKLESRQIYSILPIIIEGSKINVLTNAGV